MSDEHRTDRRWVIVAEDGRYVTLGRASDPSEEEILRTERSLMAQGLSGWLAVMQGNPYIGTAPRLMEVRALGKPKTSFDAASDACITAILKQRRAVGD